MPRNALHLVMKCNGLLFMITIAIVDSMGYVSGGKIRHIDAVDRYNRDAGPASPVTGGSHDRPSLTTYDQRQNGKYNIHVNIKDVKIIAVDSDNLDGNVGDDTVYDYGDYDYDPAHLTVSPLPIFGSGISSVSFTKPPKSTTKPPVSITSVSTTTTPPTQKPPATTESSNTSTAIPISTTPKDHGATIEVTSNDVDHKEPIEDASSFAVFLSGVNSTTQSSSNIIKIKPTPAHYDYQEIPVEVIVEPILRPKYRSGSPPALSLPSQSVRGLRRSFVKQNTVEIIPASQPQQRSAAVSCHEGEYRNRDGSCRARRSGILKLFRLLSSLEEKN